MKKLLKKEKKKQAAAAEAEDAPIGRPRTRSMDLAEIANGRPRTRSMDLAEGSQPAAASKTDSTPEKKKKKKKRALEDGDEADTKKAKTTSVESIGNGDVAAAAGVAPVLTPEEFCKTNSILVESDDKGFVVPVPMASFESTPYGGPIRAALSGAGYPAPTPTQAQSWPIALSGRDIISVARTGSGKTLGFLLPAFHAMLNRPGGCKCVRGAGPYIVVLAPTRELACQINEEATKFGKSSGIRSTTIYGKRATVVLVALGDGAASALSGDRGAMYPSEVRYFLFRHWYFCFILPTISVGVHGVAGVVVRAVSTLFCCCCCVSRLVQRFPHPRH